MFNDSVYIAMCSLFIKAREDLDKERVQCVQQEQLLHLKIYERSQMGIRWRSATQQHVADIMSSEFT